MEGNIIVFIIHLRRPSSPQIQLQHHCIVCLFHPSNTLIKMLLCVCVCVCVNTCIWVCGLMCAHGCGCLQMPRPLRVMWGLFPDGCQWNSVLIVVHTCPLRGNDSIPLLSLPFDVSFPYPPYLCPLSLPMFFSSPCGTGEFFRLSPQPQPQHPHGRLSSPSMTGQETITIHHLISADIKLHLFTESLSIPS